MFGSRTAAAFSIAAATMLGGCASIVNGNNQVVSVDARHKGQQVADVACELNNDKGTFYVKAPGTVTVLRAYGDLNVKCAKDNRLSGLAAVKSSTKPMALGNIIFGGVIGAAVDAGTGAAYDYPTLITVIMEEAAAMLPPAAAAATPEAVVQK